MEGGGGGGGGAGAIMYHNFHYILNVHKLLYNKMFIKLGEIYVFHTK